VLADQPQIVEKRLIRKDSVSQFVEFSLKLITPDIILGTVRDISHRKRTELAVQHAHEVLEE
jgi:hypothetical protein